MKPNFFRTEPRGGQPIARSGMASGLRKIAYALENLRVHNGRVEWSPDGAPTVIVEDLDPASKAYWRYASIATETEDFETTGFVAADYYMVADVMSVSHGYGEGESYVECGFIDVPENPLLLDGTDVWLLPFSNGDLKIGSSGLTGYSATVDPSALSSMTFTCGILTGVA